jgi:hypothetical protein
MLATATNVAWSPWSSEKIHEGKYETVRKASYYYILLFYCVVLGIFVLGPEVVLILGGEKYAEAVNVLPPVVMGAAFQFLYNLYVSLEQFAKKTVGMAFGTIAAALINIGLNWLLIPRYGYIAAAYTTLVGYACLLVIHFFLAKRTGYSRAYDTKFIFGSVAALFCVMLCMLWLYTKPAVIRYCIAAIVLAVIGVFAYKKKDFILSIIKKK